MATRMEDMATAEAGEVLVTEVVQLVSGCFQNNCIQMVCFRRRSWRQDQRGRWAGRYEGERQGRGWRQTILET